MVKRAVQPSLHQVRLSPTTTSATGQPFNRQPTGQVNHQQPGQVNHQPPGQVNHPPGPRSSTTPAADTAAVPAAGQYGSSSSSNVHEVNNHTDIAAFPQQASAGPATAAEHTTTGVLHQRVDNVYPCCIAADCLSQSDKTGT